MARLLIYIVLIGLALYCLYRFLQPMTVSGKVKLGSNFRKGGSKESWVQVYETASLEEAQQIQERLQQEKVECILYQQGKKDISGNSLRGVGIAVPKTSVNLAQKIISRIPV